MSTRQCPFYPKCKNNPCYNFHPNQDCNLEKQGNCYRKNCNMVHYKPLASAPPNTQQPSKTPVSLNITNERVGLHKQERRAPRH